jgi:hypothetical protein
MDTKPTPIADTFGQNTIMILVDAWLRRLLEHRRRKDMPATPLSGFASPAPRQQISRRVVISGWKPCPHSTPQRPVLR